MFCPSCGTDLPDQSKFCGSCGFQIPADGVSAAPQGGAPQAPQAAHTMMMAPGAAAVDATPNVKVATMPAPAPAAATPAGPVPSVDEVINRGLELPIGEALQEGWNLTKENLGLVVGGFFVVMLLNSVAANTFVGVVASGPIMAGFSILALRLLRGAPAGFENLFDGFKRFVPLMILGLIQFGLIFGGMLLFILPGLYFAMATTWAMYLHLDRGIEPWEAIKTSMRIVNSNFFGHFGFLFVMGLVGGLGAMACYVGALFTMPIAMLGIAWAYKKNFGLQGGAESIT